MIWMRWEEEEKPSWQRHKGTKNLGNWNVWSVSQAGSEAGSGLHPDCGKPLNCKLQHLSLSKQSYLHPCQSMMVLIIGGKIY